MKYKYSQEKSSLDKDKLAMPEIGNLLLCREEKEECSLNKRPEGGSRLFHLGVRVLAGATIKVAFINLYKSIQFPNLLINPGDSRGLLLGLLMLIYEFDVSMFIYPRCMQLYINLYIKYVFY